MKDCLVGKRPDFDAPSFTLPKSEQEMILIRFLAPVGKISKCLPRKLWINLKLMFDVTI